VIELKRTQKEKRARRLVTRPKPTIYGNCDSWSFIVGKKPSPYSPKNSHQGSLQRSNKDFIHSLLTIFGGEILDNLWAICGSPLSGSAPSRIVDLQLFNMQVMPDPRVPF